MSDHCQFGRRPLVGVALCYAVGTRLGLTAAVNPVLSIAACACVCIVAMWRVLVARHSSGPSRLVNGLLLYSCILLVAVASASISVRPRQEAASRRSALRRAIMMKCYAFRRGASRYLSAGIEEYPDAVALSRALLLGVRGEISKEARDVFRATGTLHIFAISGLHNPIIK